MTNSFFTLLETWIKGALPTVTNVIQRSQINADAPRPPKPYVVIHFRKGMPESATPYVFCSETVDPEESADVLQYHSWQRRGTLVVDIFDEYSTDLIDDLMLSLHLPSNLEIFKTANVAIHPIGDYLDTTELRDVSHDPSVQMEFAVNSIQSMTEGTPWIDEINVEIETT